MVETIPIIKKLGAQTKRPKVLVYYDFHFRILHEKEDVMFATKLDLFSIWTIEIPTHIELVSKPIHIPNLIIADLVPKQPIELVCVLVINLAIPPRQYKTTLIWNFLPSKSWRHDHWWDTCSRANTISNHSKLESYWGGTINQNQFWVLTKMYNKWKWTLHWLS
jgi:hypothetical protein